MTPTEGEIEVRRAAGAVERTVPARALPPEEELESMSLLGHLEELRRRLFWVLGTVALAFIGCWSFADHIFEFLAKPIYRYLPQGQRLVILGVTDAFMLYIKVALLAAIFVSTPLVLYHVWRFVAPGLYRKERGYALGFIFFGSLLFVSGGAFAYYVAFPFAVEFLLGVGSSFTAAITGPSYLSFMMTVILGLALMFELPVVIFFLSQVGLVTPRFLLRHFRWAVLIIFVAAALITPTPDVFNMCLFALPTMGLYLLGIAVAAIFGRKPKAAES
jgi:sec-independent protein translocase protein TatC